jgi:uncharacterized membrane protein
MRKNTIALTRSAIIAALYVALTYVSALCGLSSGVIQFRISEALCILPLFFPEAVAGLTLGCLLANLLTGAAPWDLVFGTLATFIGVFLTRLMRALPERIKWLATLPTILSNAIIIPFVLIYAYGVPDSYWFLFATVGLGELVCAGFVGSALYYVLRKHIKY